MTQDDSYKHYTPNEVISNDSLRQEFKSKSMLELRILGLVYHAHTAIADFSRILQ